MARSRAPKYSQKELNQNGRVSRLTQLNHCKKAMAWAGAFFVDVHYNVDMELVDSFVVFFESLHQ